MNKRYVYSFDLGKVGNTTPPVNNIPLRFREVYKTDLSALAELMIDAYYDTIDYDGETLTDAVSEVQAYFCGQRGGLPLLNDSRLGFIGDVLVSACLASYWDERQKPVIAYVMTQTAYKNSGIGKQTLWVVLQKLAQQGYSEVLAVITYGNTPSEKLFMCLGFERI